jgi:chromosome segregation ATPase
VRLSDYNHSSWKRTALPPQHPPHLQLHHTAALLLISGRANLSVELIIERRCGRLADAADAADSDRNTLASQLGAAKGVSMQTERSREALLRELAASDANAAALKARLEEARDEVTTLSQRLMAESEACTKLQSLLETMRSEQHKVELSQMDSGKRSEVYLERAQTAEEAMATLKRQVVALTSAGAASAREIEELKAALAAAAAEAAEAATTRNGADVAGFAMRTAEAEATTQAQARAVAALEAERAALAQQLAVAQVRVFPLPHRVHLSRYHAIKGKGLE